MAARSFNYGSGWQNGPLPPADVFIAASDETLAVLMASLITDTLLRV